MATQFYSAPGIYTTKSLAHRNIFTTRSQYIDQFAPSFSFIDGANSRDFGSSPVGLLRAGVLLGKITATGLYRPFIQGVTSADAASSATTVTVSALNAAELNRLKVAGGGGNLVGKLVGPPTAGGTNATQTLTITAVNTSTGALTVSALSAAAITGSIVTAGDGSAVPVNIVSHSYGTEVVDIYGNAINAAFNLLRGADLLTSMIVGYSDMDASVKAYVKASLKAVGTFTFDDDR